MEMPRRGERKQWAGSYRAAIDERRALEPVLSEKGWAAIAEIDDFPLSFMLRFLSQVFYCERNSEKRATAAFMDRR